MKPKRIPVKSSAGRYEVLCGTGILRHLKPEVADLGRFSSVHVVSSPNVWRALGKTVQKGLGGRASLAVHLMDDAESRKNLSTMEAVTRSLVHAGADRRSLVLAVGGGVVGDVVGFAASSYLRGVALVQVPTTLVAQVDSSIGGKTGVNLPEGKNLVGAFYPPKLITTDPAALRTLPAREFRGGLAEVIKHAIIADAKMFAYLESNIDQVLHRDRSALEYLVPANIAIKASVVSRDERESGLREILNFGHTFAHALESTTRYRRFQHGEAVALGMIAAATLGHEVGVTPDAARARIIELVHRIGPFPSWPRVSPRELIAAMKSDKKARGGKIRFVLTPRIGKAGSYDDVPLTAVARVLENAANLIHRIAKPGKRIHG